MVKVVTILGVTDESPEELLRLLTADDTICKIPTDVFLSLLGDCQLITTPKQTLHYYGVIINEFQLTSENI